jgi:hypothetical protein
MKKVSKDLSTFIDNWQKIANEIYNDGKYKELCHINPQPWYSESKTIETMLDELRVLVKTSNKNNMLSTPRVIRPLPPGQIPYRGFSFY